MAIVAAFVAACALLFSHWGWSTTGEGGRVLYALAAIAALAVALPLRSSDGRLRAASWIVAVVLLGSGGMLTRGAVERRAQAGADVARAQEGARGGGRHDAVRVVRIRRRSGSHRFDSHSRRNAQGGLDAAAGAGAVLSAQLVVQLERELPGWPALIEKNIVGRLKAESLADVTANPQASGSDATRFRFPTGSTAGARRAASSWRCRSSSRRVSPTGTTSGRAASTPRGAGHDRAQRPRAAPRAACARSSRPALARVHARGWYILGPEVEAFEREFAAYVGAAECVAVANGTDALELALRALDLGPADEVATTANGGRYATTAIRAAGAVPAYVEIDAADAADGPRRARRRPVAANPRGHRHASLRAHGGRSAGLADIARARGIALIEDCAQAHGARTGGGQAGTRGTFGCFSFYPTKNLGALGDAGAIVTGDRALAAKVRALRTYGWGAKYHCTMEGGMNSRMDELQAAVLRAKLPHLDGWNRRRREIAARYAATIRHPAIAVAAARRRGVRRRASLRRAREGARIAARASRRGGCRDGRPLSGPGSPAAGRGSCAARGPCTHGPRVRRSAEPAVLP